ncbi:hypothetical protein GCM10017788_46040 [Amycolatopsis acidiphila]|nr:hypothetical protein GCM10017788_46040 [Amycolatopsis acidiphila]
MSHPESITTPSNGFARTSSSTSIAIKFRYNIAVGRINVSPVAIVGNTNGKPPACHTPRRTASATRSKCALHGANSDTLTATPITGRPSNTSEPKP